jgi:hypothetical protein
MNKKTNILVFPCGAESALEIHLALKDVMNIRLVGASGRVDHGRMIYKNYYGNFPNIKEENFLPALNELIEKENIDLILPTHDSVLVHLAKNQDQIKTKVAVPGLWQAEVCRSKKKLYKLFSSYAFNPKVYENIKDVSTFPIYAKLDEGQGSKGAFIVEDQKTLESIEDPENYVFMELLPGEEFTIDCFTNRHGEVLFMGPRKRQRVFDGIAVQATSVPLSPEIKEIGEIVSNELKIRGSWYFQLKRDINGDLKFLEASVKIAGSGNLYRGLGVNFPLLMIYDYLGFDVKVIPNDYKIEVDRALFSRYTVNLEYDTLYVDFDDTITKEGMVNPNVIMFLYHQKNKGRTLKLITKHRYDLDKTLEDLAISKNLFDQIIHIDMEDEKYKYITERDKVIFIDNAFEERRKVREELGIPVFDVDALGTLIDWKE